MSRRGSTDDYGRCDHVATSPVRHMPKFVRQWSGGYAFFRRSLHFMSLNQILVQIIGSGCKPDSLRTQGRPERGADRLVSIDRKLGDGAHLTHPQGPLFGRTEKSDRTAIQDRENHVKIEHLRRVGIDSERRLVGQRDRPANRVNRLAPQVGICGTHSAVRNEQGRTRDRQTINAPLGGGVVHSRRQDRPVRYPHYGEIAIF